MLLSQPISAAQPASSPLFDARYFYPHRLGQKIVYVPLTHRTSIRCMSKGEMIQLLQCTKTYFQHRLRKGEIHTGRAKMLSVEQVVLIFDLFDWPALPVPAI